MVRSGAEHKTPRRQCTAPTSTQPNTCALVAPLRRTGTLDVSFLSFWAAHRDSSLVRLAARSPEANHTWSPGYATQQCGAGGRTRQGGHARAAAGNSAKLNSPLRSLWGDNPGRLHCPVNQQAHRSRGPAQPQRPPSCLRAMSFLRRCFGSVPADLHSLGGPETSSLYPPQRPPTQQDSSVWSRVGVTTVLTSPEPSVHTSVSASHRSNAEQVERLFESVAAACNSQADIWTTLQKMVDIMTAVLPHCCISINILTASQKHVKVIADRTSPLRQEGAAALPLRPISEFPSVLEVLGSGKPLMTQASDYDCDSPMSPDYHQLYTQAHCDSFAHIPLVFGCNPQGTLLIGSKGSPEPLSDNKWLASFCPMLSMYLSEGSAVKLCDLLEKLQACGDTNALAWGVVQQLHTCFEWCHPEETEARLVLLNDDQTAALVLSRPAAARDPGPGKEPAASSTTSTASTNSATSKQGEEGEFIGTQMSLTNTLTKRCLSDIGRSRIMFIDVMSAMKTYREPWRDIFLDCAVVSNPTWVLASPITVGQKRIGVMLWLSSQRLNSQRILQAARTCIPPIVKVLAHKLQQLTPGSAASAEAPSLWSHMLASSRTDGQQQQQVPIRPTALPGLRALALGNQSGGSSNTTSGGWALSAVREDSFAMPAASDAFAARCTMSKSDTASTQALVRAYEATIAQHQRSGNSASPAPADRVMAEIEVISKAGQGAFGSVYVALWKGLMVAVKIMKTQSDGRKAMRMAWELAVAKSVQHTNVVRVHAVLTDVVVEKVSKRVVRFCRTEAPSPKPGSSWEHPTTISKDIDTTPRCQVLIMEHCSMGPLSQHLQDKYFMRNLESSAAHPSSICYRGISNLCPASLSRDSPSQDAGCPGSSCVRGASQPGHSSSGLGIRRCRSLMLQEVCLEAVLPPLIDVASAMMYLHSSDIIHCDLKPENLLLKASAGGDGSSFVIKVSDFGLADLHTTDGPLIGDLGGTVTYVAPEVATQHKVTKACDVFSFGIIMYEMYTSERPYAHFAKAGQDKLAHDKALLAQIIEGLRPQFPQGACPAYVALAMRCWSADPAQRPSFLEVHAELRSILQQTQEAAAATTSMEGLGLPPSSAKLATPAASMAMAVPARPAAASAKPSYSGLPLTPVQSFGSLPGSGSGESVQALKVLRLVSDSQRHPEGSQALAHSSPKLRQVYPNLNAPQVRQRAGSWGGDRSLNGTAMGAGALLTQQLQQPYQPQVRHHAGPSSGPLRTVMEKEGAEGPASCYGASVRGGAHGLADRPSAPTSTRHMTPLAVHETRKHRVISSLDSSMCVSEPMNLIEQLPAHLRLAVEESAPAQNPTLAHPQGVDLQVNFGPLGPLKHLTP